MLSRNGARNIALAVLLLATTAYAWLTLARADATMRMHTGPSLSALTVYTLQWGVMMTAMMLPSAAPMILFYGNISRRMRAAKQRVIPAELFALTYLALWLLTGIPVYAASVVIGELAAGSPAFAAAIPYATAGTLFAAGVYQLTPVKRACLRQCVSPVDFLMRRWRDGYAASLRLAATHAVYCIGCCWALMLVLVAAGAMSLPWVLAIALVVLAEKLLPGGERTARIAGAALIALGVAVAVMPDLAGALRPASPAGAGP